MQCDPVRERLALAPLDSESLFYLGPNPEVREKREKKGSKLISNSDFKQPIVAILSIGNVTISIKLKQMKRNFPTTME